MWSNNVGRLLPSFLMATSLLGLQLPMTLRAQPMSELGGQPAPALRMGFGAVGLGMGNAVSALRTSSSVGYYNPALPPFLKHPQGSATLGLLTLDRNLNFVGYSRNLPPKAGISFAIVNAGVGEIQGRNRDGRPTETYSTSENAFIFSFGLKPKEWLAIGVSPKILYYSLYDKVSSTTVGFDFGVMTLLNEEWSMSAVIQDVGSDYKWDTSPIYGTSGNSTTDRFPLRRKIALGYASAQMNLQAGVEFEYAGSVPLVRAGANLALSEHFQIRTGIDQVSWKDDLLPRLSFGFTFESAFDAWRPGVSYAFLHDPYGSGGMHFVSVSVGFH